MTTQKQKIIKDCLHLLLEENLKEIAQTEEFRLKQLRLDHLLGIMDGSLNTDQKVMMNEILEEFDHLHAKEIAVLYERGMKDCVGIVCGSSVVS